MFAPARTLLGLAQGFLREHRHPPARAGRRRAEGWPVGRYHDGDGDHERPHQDSGQARCGDDGRDHSCAAACFRSAGLKEKLLAAKIGDIKTVLIPKGNVPDMKKIPKEITQGMTIIPVEHADQVLRLALELENPEEFLMRKGIGEMAIPLAEIGASAVEKSKESGRAVKH